MDGLSGGFVFGINGSGMITPWIDGSPTPSGANTPGQAVVPQSQLAQLSLVSLSQCSELTACQGGKPALTSSNQKK